MADPLAVIVLAAGKSTRMKSALPKPLHQILGRGILAHVLGSVAGLAAQHTCVVVGVAREQITASLEGSGALPVVQDEQRGTGDATRRAIDAIPDFEGTVLVLNGDTPLLRPETLAGCAPTTRAPARPRPC